MKLSKNFWLSEFVPPDIYHQYGDRAQWFISSINVMIMQGLRDYFGKLITINNWHGGGSRQYSGFRPPSCPIGATLSQHRLGNAVDFLVADMAPQEVREAIIKHRGDGTHSISFAARQITAMELNTNTWTHIDTRYTGQDELLTFNP